MQEIPRSQDVVDIAEGTSKRQGDANPDAVSMTCWSRYSGDGKLMLGKGTGQCWKDHNREEDYE